MGIALRLTFTLSLLTASACAYGEMDQVLRSGLASLQQCKALTVRPRRPAYLAVSGMAQAQAGQYEAEGCGKKQLYQCPREPRLVRYGNLSICRRLPSAGATALAEH